MFCIPFNSPFMSLTFSRYVRFVFHVCPVLSLRVISLHLPSCRLVSLCFVSLSFSLHSPCFHFCPFHVPFSSPLFPFHFPFAFLSCRLPISSPHFPALPCVSPLLPSISRKQHGFSSVFRKEDVQKNTECFPDFRPQEAGNPNQQRAGRGNRAWDPCFATPRLVERHQISARYVGEPPFSCTPRIRRRARGGGYPLSSLRCPTRRAMSADITCFNSMSTDSPSWQLLVVCVCGVADANVIDSCKLQSCGSWTWRPLQELRWLPPNMQLKRDFQSMRHFTAELRSSCASPKFP